MKTTEQAAIVTGGGSRLRAAVARDLARHGIRIVTIAHGPFEKPLSRSLQEQEEQSPAASIPLPRPLGGSEEFAALAIHLVCNVHVNGQTIRLDGPARMVPR